VVPVLESEAGEVEENRVCIAVAVEVEEKAEEVGDDTRGRLELDGLSPCSCSTLPATDMAS